MRSGVLNIEGGTIIGTATTTESISNGDGPSVKGAGVAIAQHITIQEITASIEGGNIEGATALYELTPENSSDSEIVSLSVAGGVFVSTTGGNAIESANKINFITGGEFKGEIKKELVSDKLETKEINGITKCLPDDWPFWFNPDFSNLEHDIKSDPRWNEWVQRTQE